MEQLLLIIFAISVFAFVRNILLLVFNIKDMKVYKKRLKQLKSQTRKDTELHELIDTITKPVITTIFPKLTFLDFEKTDEALKYAKYKINAKQFIAVKLMLKAVGILLFTLFMSDGVLPLAILFGAVPFFLPQFLLNNSVKNRKEKLMLEFPEFIRIAQGYLSANKTFERAIVETMPFLSDEWQEILRMVIVKMQNEDVPSALNFLKEEVGTLEAKEFISVVNLTLEQGRTASEGFNVQADKIQELLYDMMLIKIGRRKIYGILIQAPLLLCNIAVIGLPVVHSFMNLELL